MYVDVSTIRGKGKSYTRYLLRESYRENGKVKHRTIANLSQCSAEEIEAVRLALRHKQQLTELSALEGAIELHQGTSVGAVWLVYDIARQLGITHALGPSREGKLALWQVIARVIDQGSRLSAVRLAGLHAACDILQLDAFNEDDLYDNLDWLCAQQAAIEDRLFEQRTAKSSSGLFLYDVTSSYLEGVHNELAAFGYNRDGKRGKRQIVIGLLCDGEGTPLSIEVFAGNTQDPKTFTSQIKKVAERFGEAQVTFVGDRGMIKSQQIEALGDQQFHYITAITKPQIETLLKSGRLQMDLFDESLAEVKANEGVRYVLRRNPARVAQIAATREDKYHSLCKALESQNQYLHAHPRASIELALSRLQQRSKKLCIDRWVAFSVEGRAIRMAKDTDLLAEIAKLDGCYVLKTDLSEQMADKEHVHERYKDLALVEWAFRESKTVHLEVRPVYVRRETRTRGHAFVVMLAYLIIRALSERWRALDITVEEGIKHLASLCITEIHVKGKTPYQQVPKPQPFIRRLLDTACVRLPEKLPSKGITVTTKTKLPAQRAA